MEKLTKKSILPLLRACLWLLLIGLVMAMLIYFKGILVPIFYAVIAAFLVNELEFLTGRLKIGGKSLPLWFRRVLVLLLVIGTIFTIGEIIIANAEQISKKAPEYQPTLDRLLTQVGNLTGTGVMSADIQERINSIDFGAYLSKVFSSFSSFLGTFFMVIIYSIFLISERNTFVYKLDAIFPNIAQRDEVGTVLNRIADAVRQYLSVKTFVSLLTGVLAYIILELFGVDFPVLWAFLIFLLNYIPYLGSLIATLLPTLLAIFQFESFLMGFWVFLCIQSVQTVVGTFVEPRFAGKSLNLSPTVVLFSLAFWGALWGIVGVAIAIPISSILVIILSEFPSTRNAAILLSEKGCFD